MGSLTLTTGAARSTDRPGHGRCERVLYVDDEEPLVALMTRTLTQLEYVTGCTLHKVFEKREAHEGGKKDPTQTALGRRAASLSGQSCTSAEEAACVDSPSSLRENRRDRRRHICEQEISDAVTVSV